jgi:N-acetylglucosamine-6-phosphate deacetylase
MPHDEVYGSLEISNERICRVREGLEDAPEGDDVVNCDGHLLSAGLVDLQVNGGGGVMFSSSSERKDYEKVVRAHARLGSTSICPTVITGPMDQMLASAELAGDLCESRASAGARCVGIHVEGPFLNSAKKGGHPAEYLLDPDVRVAHEIYKACRGYLRLFTIAPELPGADDVITYLASQGVVVSMGHSSASSEQARLGFAAGARAVTHIYNAMEGMLSRAPGMVGAALASEDVYVGLIADLLHVSRDSLATVVRAAGDRRLYLTTDAVGPLGSESNEFDLYGVTVRVRDGGCYTEEGVLAGTATPLARMVKNVSEVTGESFASTLALATSVPAGAIGRLSDVGQLSVGAFGDIVLWDKAGDVNRVWIGGEEIYGIHQDV